MFCLLSILLQHSTEVKFYTKVLLSCENNTEVFAIVIEAKTISHTSTSQLVQVVNHRRPQFLIVS